MFPRVRVRGLVFVFFCNSWALSLEGASIFSVHLRDGSCEEAERSLGGKTIVVVNPAIKPHLGSS